MSSRLSRPVFLCVLTIHSLEQLRMGQNSRAESERKEKQVKKGKKASVSPSLSPEYCSSLVLVTAVERLQ